MEHVVSRTEVPRVSWSARLFAAMLLSLCVVALPDAALAYRPFDGTDAAVADAGELEIEMQPAGLHLPTGAGHRP